MVIVYPFPMHLSQGYSYMLSIAQFVNALAESCPVDLLCLDNREAIERFLRDTLNERFNPALRIIQVSNRRFGLKSNRVFFQAEVRRIVRQRLSEGHRVVVYSRDYKQLAQLMETWRSLPRPNFVFESHQILSQNYCRDGRFRDAQHFRRLECRVLEHVDALVAITPTLSKEIDRTFRGVTSRRIILPVGVSEKFFVEEGSDGRPYDIIYAGNFSLWKGIDTLIEALAEVRHSRPDFRALLVGAHEHQQALFGSLIERFGLEGCVELQGRIPHGRIPDLMRQARVGVVPVSYREDGLLFTSPLKLYEYLAAGLLVVAARVPSLMAAIPEDLVHWAVPDDAASYARAILSAFEDDNVDRLRKVAFTHEYTWQRRGERLVEFLEQQLEWG